MDEKILFIKSDITTTRAKKNKNLVSFHKRMNCCFNGTVLENVGVYPGMYAKFISVDTTNRVILLGIRKTKPFNSRKWEKIINPKISKKNAYCYLSTVNLTYDFNIILSGGFEYSFSTTNFQSFDTVIEVRF